MKFFEIYSRKVLRYDLINTFCYQNITQIPNLKKIVLNFGYQKPNFKYLVSSLLALEFLSSKKGKIAKSKHLSVFLKIKKGNPVGCVVVLRKDLMYSFYVKLKTCLFLKFKFQPHRSWKALTFVNSITFQLKNPLIFAELENQFQFFKNLPKLDITLVTTSKSQKELFFLLKSTKFFL